MIYLFLFKEIPLFENHKIKIETFRSIVHQATKPIKTKFDSNASVNSNSAHSPRELGFFENKLANAPRPGQKMCSIAPG